MQGAFLCEGARCAQGLGAARCGASRRCQMLDHLASPLPLPPQQPPGPQELPCSSEGGRENLLHQAMQNSGIVLERAPGEEGTLGPATSTVSSPQPPGDAAPELPLLEVEQVETVGPCPMVGSFLGGWTWGAQSHANPAAAGCLAVSGGGKLLTVCSDSSPDLLTASQGGGTSVWPWPC